MKRIFSAAQISTAIGKTKRGVQLALRSIPSTGKVIVRGQVADGWQISSLSARIQKQLENAARQGGYRDTGHLLSDPRERWQPPIPLNEIAPHLIDRAVKLRAAISASLRLRNNQDPNKESFESFCRTYGRVSERHWRRLLHRTIQRDAGEERFDDLTIYLDEKLTRGLNGRTASAAFVCSESDRALADQLNLIADPHKPTAQELAKLWCVACEELDHRVEQGEKSKRAQCAILRLFQSSPVLLARSTAALRKQFNRKYARWCEGGRTLLAVEDKRPTKSGPPRIPPLSERDRKLLTAHSRINCGGRISQGYRELRDAGELSPGLAERYIANPASKSYVPKTIRSAVASDVKRLDAYHHGPREHKLSGAYHTRNWDEVAAGDWFQADDLTAPIYFHTSGDRGTELMRGQLLPMIDERTTFILGFVLIQARNYNSFDIRNLITNACGEHGLPRHGFSFERGIWKSSKLITGAKNTDLVEIADTGLRRLGMRFRHATTPRAKVIERTLGQLQDMMEGLPGYCGRDERLDKFERFQRDKLDIDAGRIEASERLLEANQLVSEFAKIVARYNDAPQQGTKLNGLSPQEGWIQLQRTEPRIRFDDRLMYFLASDLRKLRVGRNGITFQIGKQRFNYKGQETGRRQGEFVFAWFNPMRTELLPCSTDLQGGDVFTVERSHELPAVDASKELLKSENRRVAAHNGYARTLYHTVKNTLPANRFRRNDLIGADALKLGEQIKAQRERATENQADRNRLRTRLKRAASRAGISSSIIREDAEAVESIEQLPEAMAALERAIQEEDNSK
jgi:hypothetical protein